MAIIEIANQQLSVGIDTRGAELAYIKGCNGTDYLWNGDPAVWSSRAPLLFPICGGLKEDRYAFGGKDYALPKHGFARKTEFAGKSVSDTKAAFVLESSAATLRVFPFAFKLTVTYELIGNKLKVTNAVENPADETMYFSIGAHEGYACPEGIEAYEIRFDEKQTLDSYILDGNLLENNTLRIIEDSDRLPLKQAYFAVDALVFKHIKFNKVTLARIGGDKKVTVEFDKAQYFLLWTKPNANYICLEPWCGVQDIVGSDFDLTKKEGIIALNGGESYTFTHTIECF